MKTPGLAMLMAMWCGTLTAAGCRCCTPPTCGGCTTHQIVHAAPCAPPCEEPCATACGPACEACMGCGANGPCPKHSGGRGLFGFLHDSLSGCNGGCGERYIHPWINDPPERCDPCDGHGNWIGARCGPGGCGAGYPSRLNQLIGHRADLDGYGVEPTPEMHGAPYDGQIIEGPMLEGPAIEEGTHGPTPAEPLPMPPDEPGAAESEGPPAPPVLPGPTTRNAAPRTRSALKKIDGRPAVYYNRAPQ